MDKDTYRVAAASSDGIVVNSHFGKAGLFHIYEVAATQFKHSHRQSCLQVSRLPMTMFNCE